MAWACGRCKKRRYADLHPYTVKLLQLAALQRAGYPLERNDLTVAEWLDLGRVKLVMDRERDHGKE